MSSVPVDFTLEDRSHWSGTPVGRALAPRPVLIEDGFSPDQATRLLLAGDPSARR